MDFSVDRLLNYIKTSKRFLFVLNCILGIFIYYYFKFLMEVASGINKMNSISSKELDWLQMHERYFRYPTWFVNILSLGSFIYATKKYRYGGPVYFFICTLISFICIFVNFENYKYYYIFKVLTYGSTKYMNGYYYLVISFDCVYLIAYGFFSKNSDFKKTITSTLIDIVKVYVYLYEFINLTNDEMSWIKFFAPRLTIDIFEIIDDLLDLFQNNSPKFFNIISTLVILRNMLGVVEKYNIASILDGEVQNHIGISVIIFRIFDLGIFMALFASLTWYILCVNIEVRNIHVQNMTSNFRVDSDSLISINFINNTRSRSNWDLIDSDSDFDSEEPHRYVPPDVEATPTDNENERCVVCLTNKKEYAYIPCGHLILCPRCAKIDNDTCYCCRGKVEKVQRIIFS